MPCARSHSTGSAPGRKPSRQLLPVIGASIPVAVIPTWGPAIFPSHMLAEYGLSSADQRFPFGLSPARWFTDPGTSTAKAGG